MRTVCRIGIIRRIKGSISIFLLIVLLPALVFSGLMADISRHHLAKAAAEEAGRLTLNSVLADYDTILKDVYGLFAISQQPGLSDDERRELLMDHFRINLENVGMFAPVLEDLQISPVPESSLANPEIIEGHFGIYEIQGTCGNGAEPGGFAGRTCQDRGSKPCG